MNTPEGTSANASWLEPALRVVNLVMAALLLFAALASLANGVRLGRTPFQLDYEEGNILNAGVRINAGLTPYPAAGSWPVVLNPYGPIPYYLTAILIRFGPPAFLWPRLAIVAAVA